MLKRLPGDTKVEDDIVYYNASLKNNTDLPIPASITDLRSQSIIDYPEDWHMSVVRFDLSTEEIPLSLIPMQSTDVGIQASELLVTLRYLGVDYQQYLFFTNLPTLPPGAIFGYNELIDELNRILAAQFTLIPGPSSSAPPFFAMDAQTNIIRCYFQDTYITAANPIDIYMNYKLFRYVYGMPSNVLSYNSPSGLDVHIELNTSFTVPISSVDRSGFPRGVSLAAMPGLVNYTSQQTQNLHDWDGIASIFITTRSLPIQSEYLPFSTNPSQNQSFSSQSNPIISDFVLDSDNPLKSRQHMEYLPTAEYRMIHLAGRENVKRIDAQFWYTSALGTPYQVNIPPGGSCGLKLMFRRKSHQYGLQDDKNGDASGSGRYGRK